MSAELPPSGAPSRTLAPDAPGKPWVPPRPVVRGLFALSRALRWLSDRLVPPQSVVLERLTGASSTQLLALMAKLGVPDLLAQGPKTAPELATLLGLHPDALGRTLRALAAGGLFRLDADSGRYANTRFGEVLRADAFGSMAAFSQYFATKANLDSWAGLEEILRTGENAFERVHGCTQWEWFARHPAEEGLFAGAMTSLTSLDALVIARAYPFGELTSLCDVAGGRGTLLAELLLRNPRLRGAVFDAPGVAPLAQTFLDRQGLHDRATVHAGNLFEAAPEGYGAYLLKDVLHDWDDTRSLAILRSVRRAAAPGARLLLCEVLVEPFDTVAPGPFIDLQMMVVCSGGRQRSAAEFEGLLRASGFRFERRWPTAAPISVLEATAV